MCLTEWDEDEAHRVWKEDDRAEGRTEGARQKAVEDATNLLKKKIPVETISECIGLPLEQVLELQKQITVQA